MYKKTMFTLAMLVLASVTAFATGQAGVVVIKGGNVPIVMATTHVGAVPSRNSSEASLDDPSLVTIFSNLAAYSKGTYWGEEGTVIQGPTGGVGPEQWRAAAFTPSTSHTATVVKVAAAWISGTNGLVLSLYNDDNGVPGKAIASAQLRNLPVFGTCCVLQVRMDGAGIPLTAGTQYWIVLSTNSAEGDTSASWVFNDTDQVDSFLEAFYCPSNCGFGAHPGWNAYQSINVTGSGLAFAVLGSK
jgi:hypothetical protein